jgi:hypothetical protein
VLHPSGAYLTFSQAGADLFAQQTAAKLGTKNSVPIFNDMEFRGVEYAVVQGIERGVWKWTVTRGTTITRSGRARSKLGAVDEAEHAIDVVLAPKKRLTPLQRGLTRLVALLAPAVTSEYLLACSV